jgi:hypothetical protein
MHVNPTLSQGLQVLMASASDQTTASSKPASTSHNLLSAANGISNQTSSSIKQASGTIGGAMLNLAEKDSGLSTEDIRERARQRAYATGSSWGVEMYDSAEDVPDPELRAMFLRVEASQKEYMAKLETVAGIHNWDEKASHQTQIIMRQMEEAISGKWTFDAAGEVTVSEERLSSMHPAERDFISNIGSKLKAAVSALSENAAVTGDVLVHNEDGTYSFGTFEVRAKDAGTLYFNHDGNGKVQFHDKGMVFSEFETTGDSWEWVDRAAYQKVFGVS